MVQLGDLSEAQVHRIGWGVQRQYKETRLRRIYNIFKNVLFFLLPRDIFITIIIYIVCTETICNYKVYIWAIVIARNPHYDLLI